MLVDPKKKECVAELVGPGCAQPEPARAVGLDALIGCVAFCGESDKGADGSEMRLQVEAGRNGPEPVS